MEEALQTPPRSMSAIHHQVTAIAEEQGWEPPSYDRVRHIIKRLDFALVTMAHRGAAALGQVERGSPDELSQNRLFV